MKHLLLPIAFFFLILFVLHSQEEWRLLTTSDGLSSNVVLNIFQANNGHIWIGTDTGINRYNGVFETDLYGPVNSIFELPSGQILAREKMNDDNTVRINLFDDLEWDEPDFLTDNDIRVSDMPEFSVLSGGNLWLSSWSGLVGFDGQKWQLYDPDVKIDWLVKTPDGRLWSEAWGIMNGIASFDGTDSTLKRNFLTE